MSLITALDAVAPELHYGSMTQSNEVDVDEPKIEIPPMTLGWRMQMAMRHGGQTRESMAAACGVSLSTISKWTNDGGLRPPRRGDLQIWARVCRVPESWLIESLGLDGEPMAGKVTPPKPWLDLVSYEGERNLSAPIRPDLCGLPSSFSMAS